MVNDLVGVVGLFTSPLPPTGDLPAVSVSADEPPMSGATLSSRAEDGRLAVCGLQFTRTEEWQPFALRPGQPRMRQLCT